MWSRVALLLVLLQAAGVRAEMMAGVALGVARPETSLLSAAPGFDRGDADVSAVLKAYVGKPLSPGFAMQAGFMSVESRRVRVEDGASRVMEAEFGLSGFFVEGRWQWRPGTGLRPYARLGLLFANIDARYALRDESQPPPGFLARTDDASSQTLVVPGLGLVVESGGGWGLQLEAEWLQRIKAGASLREQELLIGTLGIYRFW